MHSKFALKVSMSKTHFEFMYDIYGNCNIICTSILYLSTICLVIPRDTPQYLSQMKSDLHKNFRIVLLWSVKMIYDEVGLG